jgi:predicted Fe-Mo cluster-binding NifX family protein
MSTRRVEKTRQGERVAHYRRKRNSERKFRMKIAIASDDGVHIASHTGRCGGFAIYEVVEQAATPTEYRANTFTAHAGGECHTETEHAPAAEHHSHAPLINAIRDCRVLVTRGLGPRLVNDLAAQGIEVYVCSSSEVEDAARQYAEGLLPRVAGTGCCHRG